LQFTNNDTVPWGEAKKTVSDKATIHYRQKAVQWFPLKRAFI